MTEMVDEKKENAFNIALCILVIIVAAAEGIYHFVLCFGDFFVEAIANERSGKTWMILLAGEASIACVTVCALYLCRRGRTFASASVASILIALPFLRALLLGQ